MENEIKKNEQKLEEKVRIIITQIDNEKKLLRCVRGTEGREIAKRRIKNKKLRKELRELLKNIDKNRYKHYSWCPSCFDALDCIDVKLDGEIKSHFYSCNGCERDFKLVESD